MLLLDGVGGGAVLKIDGIKEVGVEEVAVVLEMEVVVTGAMAAIAAVIGEDADDGDDDVDKIA